MVVSQLMCPCENIDFNLKSTWFKMFVIFNPTLRKDLQYNRLAYFADLDLETTWFKLFVMFNPTLGKDLHIAG